MTRTRYQFFENAYPYFLTCTTVNWIPAFSAPSIAQIVINSLAYLHSRERLILHAYVIMENRFHLIASSPDPSREVRILKSYTARQIFDHLKDSNNSFLLEQLRWHRARHKTDQTYQFWQQGCQPKQIYDAAIFRQKADYIHNNPVKRGYVDLPEHWRYSSARNYRSMPAVLDIRRVL